MPYLPIYSFLECPFCGAHPVVSNPEWQDDARYLAVTVECCATMVVTMSWREARELTQFERHTELTKRAETAWNKRYDPNEE